MSNKNCENIKNSDSCYSCYSCNYCNSCYSCYSCKNIRMSEKMIFCLGEGKYVSSGIGYQKNLYIFNKPVSEEVYKSTKNSLDVKNFKLPIAKWIELKDMTKDEETETRKQMGGYLKTLSYEDAWKEMWSTLSQEDKNFFKTIPNFDSEIFEAITGIKIDEEVEELTMEEICKRLGKTIKIKK